MPALLNIFLFSFLCFSSSTLLFEIYFESIVESKQTLCVFNNVSSFISVNLENVLYSDLELINENEEKMQLKFMNGSITIMEGVTVVFTNLNIFIDTFSNCQIFKLSSAYFFKIEVKNIFKYSF